MDKTPQNFEAPVASKEPTVMSRILLTGKVMAAVAYDCLRHPTSNSNIEVDAQGGHQNREPY